jgi:hypothetical protein
MDRIKVRATGSIDLGSEIKVPQLISTRNLKSLCMYTFKTICVSCNMIQKTQTISVVKPDRWNGFSKGSEIRSTPFLGSEVNPLFQCRKILRHVKATSKYEQRYFEG